MVQHVTETSHQVPTWAFVLIGAVGVVMILGLAYLGLRLFRLFRSD